MMFIRGSNYMEARRNRPAPSLSPLRPPMPRPDAPRRISFADFRLDFHSEERMLSHFVALLAFQLPNHGRAPDSRAVDVAMNFAKAKPIHKDPSNPMKSVFKVEKATEKQLAELGVKSWPTWSTEGSAKYKTGEISALKVYDTNELSYIISGKMEIIPEETGKPVLVQEGGACCLRAPVPSPMHHSAQMRALECLLSQILSRFRMSSRVDGTCWKQSTSTGSSTMPWACPTSELPHQSVSLYNVEPRRQGT